MLRRSHKKSRGGCLECKRRHVKCDEQRPSCRLCTVSERQCSFASQIPRKSLSTSNASSRSVSPRVISRLDATTDAPLTPTSLHNTPSLEQPGVNGHHEPSLDEPINFNHMELLAHLTMDKDMFNLGVRVDDYYANIVLGLKTGLKSPYLMHQILAYSARHLAFLHTERSEFYLQQAVILQTRAVSLFTAVPITIDQSNCMPVLLFSAILGHHLLADALAKRYPSGLDGFLVHFIQCAQTYSGVYAIAKSAWPLLLESELGTILSLSADFTSRQPKGSNCERIGALVDSTTDLSEEERGGCRLAIQYLQVGLDAALAEDREAPLHRNQMISEWTMLVRPEFTRLLTAKRPVALIVLAHYALLLHYGRHLWQVGDTGAYMLCIIGDELGPKWDYWLEYPRVEITGYVG